MDIQGVATTRYHDLSLRVGQIIPSHYSYDLHHYYEIKYRYNLQPIYTTYILYNMLEYSRYHLGMVVSAGSQQDMCRG